jgi:hypothetical protein
MKHPSLLFFSGLTLALNATPLIHAAETPQPTLAKKGELILEESFDDDTLPKGWTVQTGDWKPVGGVLVAREIPADHHAAAARRLLPMQDGIFQLRFRLAGKAKAFHFGFDPARGELKKKGHLFSIIVTPTGAKLMKHIDKDKPKEDPNEILASSNTAFKAGIWHTLLLEKQGNHVAAQIVSDAGDSSVSLAGSHPTFHVKTPTLVFRCAGDGVGVDDVRVWKTSAVD